VFVWYPVRYLRGRAGLRKRRDSVV
jgi:hypothetical protein